MVSRYPAGKHPVGIKHTGLEPPAGASKNEGEGECFSGRKLKKSESTSNFSVKYGDNEN